MGESEEQGISRSLAVSSCAAMALCYVAILYSPTLVLRLPPPADFKTFMIRRFICAAVSSVLSLIICALILPIGGWNSSYLFGVYGIRFDHMWQAVLFPVLLSSLVYTGSFVAKIKLVLKSSKEQMNHCKDHSSDISDNNVRDDALQIFIAYFWSTVSSVTVWRNYIVAPVTEELVFRACMIPLLLCGGFGTYAVIFFCPIFFSLAHLNHFVEIYIQQNCNLLRAAMVIGIQLGYTMLFGSYAAFLFIRTGHLIAPLVAHVFCNIMGLPIPFAPRNAAVSLAFAGGLVSFIWLLFPATYPGLYNDRTDSCNCWQRYCIWS